MTKTPEQIHAEVRQEISCCADHHKLRAFTVSDIAKIIDEAKDESQSEIATLRLCEQEKGEREYDERL
jgi:hypothetical protein